MSNTGLIPRADWSYKTYQRWYRLLRTCIHPLILMMCHDFITGQPVKNARAYYMHSVLPDGPHGICGKIFANIVAAMKPGCSKLLVNENVIPDTGA
ncbi:hypothetical protein BJX76DRAFT_336158 [Aspergillus varians]